MNSKVKIPREVAVVIEQAWDNVNQFGITKHLYLTNWEALASNIGVKQCNILMQYARDNMITYAKALVEDYEILDQCVVDVTLKDGTIISGCTRIGVGDKNNPHTIHKASDIKKDSSTLRVKSDEYLYLTNKMFLELQIEREYLHKLSYRESV